jgi:cholesterol transport system auxiliary component
VSFSGIRGRAGILFAFLSGLALAGCGGGGELQTFELLAPQEYVGARQARGSLVVALPTALRAIDSERVIVQPTPGEINYLAGARWSDRVPRLVQARIIEAFENSRRVRAVSREGEKLQADYKLDTEVREFGLLISPNQQAVVEISVRLVNARTGRVIATQVFTGRAEASSADGPSATAAINHAFGSVLIDLVSWATARI